MRNIVASLKALSANVHDRNPGQGRSHHCGSNLAERQYLYIQVILSKVRPVVNKLTESPVINTSGSVYSTVSNSNLLN